MFLREMFEIATSEKLFSAFLRQEKQFSIPRSQLSSFLEIPYDKKKYLI